MELDMDKHEFVKQQYLTLRDEIRECKRRLFYLLLIAALFVPGAAFAADKFGAVFATASMPFVLLLLMLGAISEQNGIVRAGRYLREHVEPHIDGVVGWERWLESSHRLRDVDRYFFGSFLLLMMVFYGVGTGYALQSLANLVQEKQIWLPLLGYSVAGLWVLIVWLRHWHSCTTTKE